jgi:PAS domain S-box-containing protein
MPYLYMNLKGRPHLFWAGLAVLILVAESALFYSIWTSFAASEQWSIHTHQVLEKIESLLSEMMDAETGQRGDLLTGKDRYLEPYNRAIQSIPAQLAELRKLTSDNPRQQSRIENLRPLIAARLALLKEIIELRRTGGAGPAIEAVSSDRGKQIMDRIRVVIQAMRANELSLLNQGNQKRLAAAHLLILVMACGAGFLLIVLLAGSRAINRDIKARALAEAAERTQRELLQVTLKSIGDGVIATDPNGRVTLINPVAAQLTGWPPQEAQGQPLETVFTIRNEETGNKVENPALRAIRDGKIVGLANHTILIERGGRRIPLEDSGAPIVDASGNTVGAVLIFRDRSEKKAREADLLRRDRMLRFSFDAILITDAQRRIRFWNRGAFKLYGWGEAEVRDEILSDLLRTSPPAAERDEILFQQGQWRGELVQTCKDGRVVTVESRHVVLRDPEGKIDGILQINRDITERKRSEEKIAWLASFPERNTIPIAEVEQPAGVIRYANPAARRLFPDLQQRGFSHPWLAGLEQIAGTLAEGHRDDALREVTVGDRCYAQSVYYVAEEQRLRVYGVDITERKRAEMEIERQARLLGQAYEPIFAWDLDGTINYWNNAAETLYGFSREEAMGRFSHELLQTKNPAGMAQLDAILASAGSWTGDLMQTAKDGRRIHIETVMTVVADPDGRRVVLETGRDITERKRAEEALRESEAQFRTLANAIPQLCWMANADGWIFWYNQRWYDYTGATPEQMQGWGWQSVHDPEALPKVLEHWKASIATGEPFDMVFPLRGAEGVFRPFLTRIMPVRDADGKVARWFGTNTDISEQRKTEEALAASEGRFRALLDSASQGVVAVNESGRMVLVNAKTEEMFGYTRKELLGQPLEVLLPERYRTEHGEHLQHYFASPRTRVMGLGLDLWGRSKNGNEFPLEVSLSWVEQGGSRLAMALITDITERKRAEEGLRQAQKLESLGLLAGGVAHDFNNLLVGVIGNASLAQEMLSPNHPAAELLDGVLKTGEQAAHLTRQMLAYSGKGKFVVEPLDLSALIPEMCGLVQPSLPKKITLSLNPDPDLPAIEADRGQVQQIFMNLALNAGEAIGSHDGLISVRTYVEEVDEPYLRLHPEAAALRPGKYVCLEVRDTGCGMDEATKARIFDPFFTTKFTGRGLGLAAVAGIVRGHKGAITVSSAVGKGTCFTVLFPAVEQAVEASPVGSPKDKLHGAGVVLVVDDEQVVRELAKKALERHGYTVLLADSGLAAIDVLRRHTGEIALVVLDLSMPHMGGEEALLELRKIRPEVKVVVSSGYSEAETMALFQGQRVSGFIQKPYTSKQLAVKVKACVG